MKTFQSKNLHDSRTVGLLKGLTLLFLGASVAVLATYGLTIDPSINNSVQYIQKIILTSDGTASGATGVVLDGSDGNVYFAGKMGIGIANPTSQFEVASGGDISLSPSSGSATIKMSSGPSSPNGLLAGQFGGLGIMRSLDGNLSLLAGSLFGTNGDVTITTGGRVGIETSTPSATLDVNGTGKFAGNLLVDGKVGIGISNPTSKFEVASGGNISLSPDSGSALINIKSNSSSPNGLLVRQLPGLGLVRNTDGNLTLIAGSLFQNGSITITTGGYIGIETSAPPSATLDVNGTGKFAGNLLVDGKVGIGTASSSEALNVSGDVKIGQNDLILKDTNHGIGYGSGFASTYIDGPAVYGWDGGALGETNGTDSVVLRWKENGNVEVAGSIKIGNTSDACNSTTAGTLKTVDGSYKELWYCDGSSRGQLW